jgi:GNAT superfamily N-acetyltransferase
MLSIRRMTIDEIDRVREIDRCEHVTQAYTLEKGMLELRQVDWRIPPWSADDSSDHSVQAKIAAWGPILESGGTMLGAFDGDRLAGFAIYRPDLTEGTAQLAVLHVTCSHRRQGVGSALVNETVCLARADGAARLYVSATPSKPTVGFYMSRGFRPTHQPNPELYELEPEDIHMIKDLGRP